MSRVIRFQQFGPAEVLVYETAPTPQPAAGEVLIRVEAIGVSWNDVLWRQDLAPEHARLPAGLGSELAGEVIAVGDGVDDLPVGCRVASFPAHSPNRYPAYGDCMLMPHTALTRYPDVLSPVEASVHYTPLLIAYFAFTELARLKAGQRVLITAASQCFGPAAIQLAKALGAEVIASTARADDRDYLLELGATQVILTEEQDLVSRIAKITDGRGVEVVFDALGGPQMALLGDVMAPCGRLILYGLNGGNQTPFPACAAFKKNFKFHVHCIHDFTGLPEMGIPQEGEVLRRALTHLNQLTADRLLQPQIDRVFAFNDVQQAHRYMETCPNRGRVVLKVGE